MNLNNLVFYNNSTYQQAPVETQLKIALWKLAHDGSASSFCPSASQWGVSEGHISDCTKRIIVALFQLCFLETIGKADSTDIVLQYKPGRVFDSESFWNRKKRYAIDLCGACDSSKKFTYMLTGFSNATDSAYTST